MKNAEFISLLIANTNKTKNLRTFAGKWVTGAARVPNEITTQIGRVVALLQAKINEGLICKKDSEGLLVYNFQPILFNKSKTYCSMEMLIRPVEELDLTHLKTGTPFHIIIEGTTTEVCNATKGLLDVGIISAEEIVLEGMEPPRVYGKYRDFLAICGFVALGTKSPLDPQELFAGQMDQSEEVQNALAFDSCVEARAHLDHVKAKYCYVVESIDPKEKFPEVKQMGLSKVAIKIIDLCQEKMLVTPNPIAQVEKSIGDEVKRHEEALHELATHTLCPDEDMELCKN